MDFLLMRLIELRAGHLLVAGRSAFSVTDLFYDRILTVASPPAFAQAFHSRCGLPSPAKEGVKVEHRFSLVFDGLVGPVHPFSPLDRCLHFLAPLMRCYG